MYQQAKVQLSSQRAQNAKTKAKAKQSEIAKKRVKTMDTIVRTRPQLLGVEPTTAPTFVRKKGVCDWDTKGDICTRKNYKFLHPNRDKKLKELKAMGLYKE